MNSQTFLFFINWILSCYYTIEILAVMYNAYFHSLNSYGSLCQQSSVLGLAWHSKSLTNYHSPEVLILYLFPNEIDLTYASQGSLNL